jgi:hypothetical protein
MRGKRSIRPSVDLDNCQERYRILSDPKDKCVLATLEHHQGPNSITALTNPLKIVATIAPYFGGAISVPVSVTPARSDDPASPSMEGDRPTDPPFRTTIQFIYPRDAGVVCIGRRNNKVERLCGTHRISYCDS